MFLFSYELSLIIRMAFLVVIGTPCLWLACMLFNQLNRQPNFDANDQSLDEEAIEPKVEDATEVVENAPNDRKSELGENPYLAPSSVSPRSRVAQVNPRGVPVPSFSNALGIMVLSAIATWTVYVVLDRILFLIELRLFEAPNAIARLWWFSGPWSIGAISLCVLLKQMLPTSYAKSGLVVSIFSLLIVMLWFVWGRIGFTFGSIELTGFSFY